MEHPRVEAVNERDPDGPTQTWVFLDGRLIDAAVVCVDPGAGHTRADWEDDREANCQGMSPDAQELIRELYHRHSGSEHITDP